MEINSDRKWWEYQSYFQCLWRYFKDISRHFSINKLSSRENSIWYWFFLAFLFAKLLFLVDALRAWVMKVPFQSFLIYLYEIQSMCICVNVWSPKNRFSSYSIVSDVVKSHNKKICRRYLLLCLNQNEETVKLSNLCYENEEKSILAYLQSFEWIILWRWWAQDWNFSHNVHTSKDFMRRKHSQTKASFRCYEKNPEQLLINR